MQSIRYHNVKQNHKLIETTDIIATLYSKARATTVTGYKFTATFSEKKVQLFTSLERKQKPT